MSGTSAGARKGWENRARTLIHGQGGWEGQSTWQRRGKGSWAHPDTGMTIKRVQGGNGWAVSKRGDGHHRYSLGREPSLLKAMTDYPRGY